MLGDINPNGSAFSVDNTPFDGAQTPWRERFHALNYNGTLFFAADDGVSNMAVNEERINHQGAKTPRKTGTTLAWDVNPGPTGSNPTALMKINPLFFIADTASGTQVVMWTTPIVAGAAAPATTIEAMASGEADELAKDYDRLTKSFSEYDPLSTIGDRPLNSLDEGEPLRPLTDGSDEDSSTGDGEIPLGPDDSDSSRASPHEGWLAEAPCGLLGYEDGILHGGGVGIQP
jgi:hypothetical protein